MISLQQVRAVMNALLSHWSAVNDPCLDFSVGAIKVPFRVIYDKNTCVLFGKKKQFYEG